MDDDDDQFRDRKGKKQFDLILPLEKECGIEPAIEIISQEEVCFEEYRVVQNMVDKKV